MLAARSGAGWFLFPTSLVCSPSRTVSGAHWSTLLVSGIRSGCECSCVGSFIAGGELGKAVMHARIEVKAVTRDHGDSVEMETGEFQRLVKEFEQSRGGKLTDPDVLLSRRLVEDIIEQLETGHSVAEVICNREEVVVRKTLGPQLTLRWNGRESFPLPLKRCARSISPGPLRRDMSVCTFRQGFDLAQAPVVAKFAASINPCRVPKVVDNTTPTQRCLRQLGSPMLTSVWPSLRRWS